MRAGQRVDGAGVVGDPVDVAAPHGGVAGVEACGRLGRAAYPQVGGEDAVDPPDQRVRTVGQLVEIEVHDLPAGMDAGVGAPGTGQPDGRQPQHGRQRRGQLALDGPEPRLRRPAVEVRAVVGEVEADPHRVILSAVRPAR